MDLTPCQKAGFFNGVMNMFELTLMNKLLAAGAIFSTGLLLIAAQRIRGKRTAADAVAINAELALEADKDPVSAAEKMWGKATSYVEALKSEGKIKLALLILFFVLANDMMLGFETLPSMYPDSARLGIGIGLFLGAVDLIAFVMIFTDDDEDNSTVWARHRSRSLFVFAVTTSIIAGIFNGYANHVKTGVDAQNSAGSYTSLVKERDQLTTSIASLITQESKQRESLNKAIEDVDREHTRTCDVFPERCPRWNAAKDRRERQRAVLTETLAQKNNERKRLAEVKVAIAKLDANGKTQAGAALMNLPFIPIAFGCLMLGAFMIFSIGGATYKDWRKRRLHATADKVRDLFGDDIFKKSLLSQSRPVQQIALERVDFAEVETIQKIEIVQKEDTPKTPQHRDILKLFTDGFILKADASSSITTDDVLSAYKSLSADQREGRNMSDHAARMIILDAIRYVEDANLTKDGIQGWKLNLSKVTIAA